MNPANPNIDLDPRDMAEVIRILQQQVPELEVWAFGSRVKNTAKPYSDLDLALITTQPLSLERAGALKEAFDESNLPMRVDVVDWATTSEGFRKIIERDKVVMQKASDGRSSEWSEVEIGDVCSVGDGAHSKVTRQPNGVLYLTSKNIGKGFLKLDNVDYISEEDFDRLFPEKSKATRKPQSGDVLIGIIGTFGNAYLYKSSDHFGFASSIGILRPNPSRLNSEYLYYVLTSRKFQITHANYNAGSVQGYTNIPTVKKLSLPLPPVKEQTRIAGIFKALDDRITLLRETNATLEAIAQALFKSWFVDFDPVHAKQQGRAPDGMDEATAALFPDSFEESELGLVPKGWSSATLADAYEINPQRKLRKGVVATYLDMANVATAGHCVDLVVQREMGSGSKFQNGDTLLGRITPCLENGKSAFVDFLGDDETAWGSTEFLVLRPKAPLPEYHAYLLCRHQQFRDFAVQSMSGTSGRQRIQNDVLGRYTLAIPSESVALEFGYIVKPIQQKIADNHEQAQTLATLRDTLLPRLISGQLRLPEAEAMI